MDNKIVNLKNLKILYVEDDQIARNQMKELLEIMFDKVIVAEDGQNGYELFSLYEESSDDIDIILTDINMPHLNGIEMVKKIRTIKQHIPVIFLSAHNEEEYLIQAIKLHVSDYIFKPMKSNELVQAFKKAYLPIYQHNIIKTQNEELKIINEKIKRKAKEEFDNIQLNFGLEDENDIIDISSILDSIEAHD